jgi:hypothetical protein
MERVMHIRGARITGLAPPARLPERRAPLIVVNLAWMLGYETS